MTINNRHLVSFLLSSVIYGVAIVFIFGLKFQDKIEVQEKVDNFQTIKIALVSPQLSIHQETLQTEQKQIITPIQEKQNFKSEPIIETKIEKKQEPIVTIPQTVKIPQTIQKIEPIKEVKQEIQQQVVVQPQKQILQVETKSEPKPQLVAKPIIASVPKIVKPEPNKEEIQNKKKEYFALVKNTIDKHKYYPSQALRRGIECDIKVKFIISQMGQLVSLELIEGNKLFHNSVKEAIESSFPLLPPKNILAENETLNLVISYTIN